MRALAHPTRLALLDHLHANGPSTATECSEFVRDSPSSCSYHLRALAKWGFVEEGPPRPGRERPWQATAARIEFPSDGLDATILRDELVARQQQRVRDALRREHELPPRWRRAAQTSSATLELSASELEEFGERFEALLDEFRGRGARRGTRTVVISFGAVGE
ncbi:MAG TPA: helix-turn-helix domain-containing protein [Gaiellaceae bacterium]|nr:helix-turn-helix domain-containing protein [Gaiellaceae bacterium]